MIGFSSTRALITGGSSGIGRALAHALVREGAHVCIVARRQAGIDATLAELRALAASPEQIIIGHALDVGDAEAVAAAIDPILAQLGSIDLLINNAGITHPATLLDTPTHVVEDIMRINFHGAVHMTRAVLPSMIAARRGHVSFVSSLAGVLGIYGYTAYAASKFALRGFAECLRQELLAHDIGVSVVLPPDTDTPMLAAEAAGKPPETAMLAGTVKPISAEFVATQTLAGIRSNRFLINPGFATGLIAFAATRLPRLTRWIIDRDLRRFWRRDRRV